MRAVRRVGVVVVAAIVAGGLSAGYGPITAAAEPADAAPVAPTTAYRVPAEQASESDRTDPAWLNPTVTLSPESTAEVDVPSAGWARAGSTPVSVAAPVAGVPAARVRVRLLSQAEVAAFGGRLFGFEVSRADGGTGKGYVGVSVDYAAFAKAYGGNFASRLRLAPARTCQADLPCVTDRVAARNEVSSKRLLAPSVAAPPESASGPTSDSGFGPQPADEDTESLLSTLSGTYVTTTSASGAAGDYSASSVSPADSWDVGVGSGAFTYSYPVVVPPAVGGAAPSLSFDYSSQAVDGRTVTANGQAPKTGEGWSFEPGFIERKFETCPSGSNAGEKCWSPNNEYVLQFGGRGGEMIRDAATGEWRLRGGDPAWKILERTGGPNADNNGEYFVLITPNGTKHWFGLGAESTVVGAATTNSVQEVPVYGGSGEPCYSAVASQAWCQQAYRWNLDRVVDPNNNVTTFFYGKETNRYSRWSTTTLPVPYARSSYLTRVEYGQRAGSESSESPWARVLVTVADRCAAQASCPTPSAATASSYPDVPMDLMCTSATSCAADQDAPTFWSTKQVESVQTEFRDVQPDPDVWELVSTYSLNYSFPSTADGTDPSLWLTDVTRTGEYGTGATAMPGLRLNGVRLQNRVNTGTGVPGLNKWRVGYVSTDLNARLVITYDTPHPCPLTPSFPTNATDCYPAWYDPQDGVTQPGWVLFYKYLVTRVVTEDNRGNQPSQTVNYTYNDTPAWHYDDSLLAPAGTQSWADYRGHSSVDVTVVGDSTNDGTTTRYTLFRGMHGDKLTSTTSKTVQLGDSAGGTTYDYHYLAGLPLEAKRLNASGFAFASTVHRYWAQQTINGPDGWQSHDTQYVREGTTIERTLNTSTSAWRDHLVTREYVAATGALRSVSDSGDPGVVGDGSCMIHGYAYSTDTWIISAPYRTDTYAGGCSTQSPTKIAQTDFYYDGQAFQAAPTKGNVTSTWAYSAAGVKSVTNTGYDAYGRVTSVIAPNEVASGGNGATTTSYDPATGYPYNGATTTNVLGQTSTLTAYSAFGTPRFVTDVNNQVTTINVDNLGRTTWVARPGDTAGVPSSKFDYVIGSGTPNRIATHKLLSGTTTANAVYVAAYDYLDGLGRVVQTQMPAADGVTATTRRLIVTRYDAAGGTAAVSQPFAATGAPGSDLAVVAAASVPFESRNRYDYAGRIDRTAQYASGFEKSATATTFRGWSYTVDHPVRSNVDYDTDVYGRTTKIVEYPAGGTATTTYKFTRLGDLERITDDAGNVTAYGYDWLRRRTSSTDPDQGAWSTEYTAEGDVKKVTDAETHVVHHLYDRLRRKTETWADAVGAGGTQLAGWRYDNVPAGETSVSNAVGRLTRATSYSGGNPYTVAVNSYDVRGRVTGKEWRIPSVAGAVAGTYGYTYGYNPKDDLLSVTVPAAGALAAETVTTGINNAGLPTTLTTSLDAANPYVAGTTYQGDGRLATRALVGGVQRTYGYDATAGRLRTLQTTAPEAGSPSTIEDVLYGYDAENNVTSITDFEAGASGVAQRECFEYDPLNRLKTAFTTNTTCGTPGAVPMTFGADPYDLGYAYDDLGNITSARTGAVTTSYGYAGSGHAHAPSAVGGATYGYDANGATTLRPAPGGSQTLTWNRLHQLAAVSGSGASSFVYDADGARLVRVTGTTATLYLDGMEVSGPTSGAGTSATRYYGGFASRTAAGVTVLLRNNQNSTTVSYNPTTDTPTYQRYTPFGSRRGTTPLPSTDRRFLDKAEDATGLVAMGARYYDPGLGRFASPDPFSDLARPQTLAVYSYSLNNPATFSDPTGLMVDRPDVASATKDDVTRAKAKADAAEVENAYYRVLNAAHTVDPSLLTDDENYLLQKHLMPAWDGDDSIREDPWGQAALEAVFTGTVLGIVNAGRAGAAAAAEESVAAKVQRDALREALENGAARVGDDVTEGIYLVVTKETIYIGQSNNITRRLMEHVAAQKINGVAAEFAARVEVLGGKTNREIAEQLWIRARGEVENLANIRNPIGAARADLLKELDNMGDLFARLKAN